MKKTFGFLILLLLSSLCLAAPPIKGQLGVWRHVSFLQIADGKVVRQYDATDGTTVEYRSDGTWSMNGPKYQSSGTFRVMRDGRVSHTITKSNLAHQIGYISVKAVDVDGQMLVLSTEHDSEAMKKYPLRADGTRPSTMKIVSTFRKIHANE